MGVRISQPNIPTACLVLAAGTASCSYDFDGAFAEPPLYGSQNDGGADVDREGSSDVATEEGIDADGDTTTSETGGDGCWPSCQGKCEGADDGCGNPCPQSDCGGTCCGTQCCDQGETCDDEQQCCTPLACNAGGIECGTHDDGCGGTISCGGCSEGPCSETGQCTGCSYGACNGACCNPGQVCDQNGACCSPSTCADLGAQCGMHDDGCGNPISCGTCSADAYCLSGFACTSMTFHFRTLGNGTFTMGSPQLEPVRDEYTGGYASLDEGAHTVTLTQAFEISDVEITQGHFEVVMGYNPAYFDQCGSDCPVEYVTWDEAAAFCNELSVLKQLDPCFSCSGTGSSTSCSVSPVYSTPYDCVGYRLPTEAEWEYAARAGTQTAFHSGALSVEACDQLDPSLNPIGWYIANGAVTYPGSLAVECNADSIDIGTHPVRMRADNPFALFDMAGNVWEWVMDCGAPYPSGAQVDPLGPMTCNHRYKLYRGGGSGNTAAYCRHAERADYTPSSGKNIDIGFRPVRSLL